MKLKHLFAAASLSVLAIGCIEKPDGPKASESMDGIIINEVSPSKTMGRESWIELYNTTDKTINLKGLQVILTGGNVFEETICTLSAGSIEPEGRFVISSEEQEFSAPMLLATFEEIAIANRTEGIISSFSAKYDLDKEERAEEGQSYAIVPDATGRWTITDTPTNGERNYKVVAHDISKIIINEVCPAEGWIEIYNPHYTDIEMEYSFIKSADGTKIYTAEEALTIPSKGRIVAQCEASAGQFKEFTVYNNQERKVLTFKATGLADTSDGQSWSRLPDVTGNFTVSESSTKGEINQSVTTNEKGLVINEISPLGGWVEISNGTVQNISTEGVILKADGKTIYESGKKTFAPHEYVTVDASISSVSKFTLENVSGKVLDSFQPYEVKDKRESTVSTSWNRIPDGTGSWFTLITPTKGEKNSGITENNKIAIWVNHSSMDSINLQRLVDLGIGNILIHEFIFRSDKHSQNTTRDFIDKAHALGMTVHIWMQCFHWEGDVEWPDGHITEGGWISAVIDPEGDKPPRYNQERFDEIIKRGVSYLKNYDIDGLHYDYVRFGGSASKHTYPEQGVTATGAITELCRQSAENYRAIKKDVILSAALMGEANSMAYYGQDPAEMTKYFDIMMPMAYISSYGYSASRNVSISDWFTNRCQSGKESWHGIATYNSSSQGLSETSLYNDCANIANNSCAQGLALFRYGLGTLPDLNEFYK